MTKLKDMEELLEKISNKEVVDYMREASMCYSTGAHRGCVVLSYIALFDDMRAKLSQFSKINSAAKLIWQEVEKRAGNQEVFESYMADKLQSEGFLTTAEHKQLGIIRDIRNRAAHPSGIKIKAEEARYIYCVVIDDFLSQSLLKTTHAVDALISRLEKSNFFPTTNIDEISEIAKQETLDIHPSAYPYLFAKLIDSLKGTDEQKNKNAERMVVGLARLNSPVIRDLIRSSIVVKQSHDKEFGSLIGRVIASDALVLAGLNADAIIRVRALLEASLNNVKSRPLTRLSHPAKQLAAMIVALGEVTLLNDYPSLTSAVIKMFPFSSEILQKLDDSPKIFQQFVKFWKKSSSSTTFETANGFADALAEIDDYCTLLSGEDALHLISGVVEAAEWGARRSKSLRTSKFKDAPNIRKLAIDYIGKNQKSADKIIGSHLSNTTASAFLQDELTES